MSAERAWEGMRSLVLAYDRRGDVSELLGMSFVRVKALRYVAERAMTGRELATVLATDPPFVSVIVDDLEERGLVARTPHPTDRRAKMISATPAGRDLADRAARMLAAPPAALQKLPRADLATLDRIIETLLAAQADGQ